MSIRILKRLTETVPISKLTIIIMLVGAILIGFLFGIIYRELAPFAQEQEQNSYIPIIKNRAINQPTSSAKASDETANWKTYINKEYGFEVKYPPDFKEQKAESDTGLLTITKTDRGSSYYFGISVIKNYKINQIVSKTREVKEINIGNHLGYKYFYIEGLGMSEVALVQIGQDALNISFDLIGNGQNFATTNDRKIYLQDFFNQLLSTFKFTTP